LIYDRKIPPGNSISIEDNMGTNIE
jgi:hypothetical protein